LAPGPAARRAQGLLLLRLLTERRRRGAERAERAVRI